MREENLDIIKLLSLTVMRFLCHFSSDKKKNFLMFEIFLTRLVFEKISEKDQAVLIPNLIFSATMIDQQSDPHPGF